jgi:ketosteroid isomerase-like protein
MQTMVQDNVAISKADLDAWLSGYEWAWEQKDAAAAAKLFAADAEYFETPYAEPFKGPAGISEYWARVTADQRDIDFRYSVVAVDGKKGVATWSAIFTTISGGVRVELNGTFVLEFADPMHCSALREWWHAR